MKNAKTVAIALRGAAVSSSTDYLRRVGFLYALIVSVSSATSAIKMLSNGVTHLMMTVRYGALIAYQSEVVGQRRTAPQSI